MSKTEEALNYVWNHYYTEELGQEEAEQIELNLRIVEQALQALNIIKEKNLFDAIHKYIFDFAKNYESYCTLFKAYKLDEANKLTQHEFLLVKEVL